MKVFLSWSGDRSRAAAQALDSWIPDVLQEVDTWMSTGIGAGRRWSMEIDQQLSETDFGVLCLTRENLQAPWLLFEAGALAKRVQEDARVVPYLLDDIEPGNVEQPLGLFQSKKADESGTYELIHSINSRLDDSVARERVDRTFSRAWPHLEKMLRNIPSSTAEPKQRSDENKIDEVLENVRSISRRLDQGLNSFPIPPPISKSHDEVHGENPWSQVVKTLRIVHPAVTAIYAEAWCLSFNEDELVLEFPQELSIYAKLAGDSRGMGALLDVIDRLYGFTPSKLSFVVSEE